MDVKRVTNITTSNQKSAPNSSYTSFLKEKVELPVFFYAFSKIRRKYFHFHVTKLEAAYNKAKQGHYKKRKLQALITRDSKIYMKLN